MPMFNQLVWYSMFAQLHGFNLGFGWQMLLLISNERHWCLLTCLNCFIKAIGKLSLICFLGNTKS